MSDEQPASKKPAVIRVNDSWCKRCGICVAFCPKDVLEINEGVLKVARPEDCISCMLCELRCPDFAITVEEE